MAPGMRALPDAPDSSESDPMDRLLVLASVAFVALAALLAAVVLVASLPLGALGGSTLATLVFTLLLVAVGVAVSRLGRRRSRPASPRWE